MAVLAWGKPDIYIQLLDAQDAPKGRIRKVGNPKEDSTNLETAEGDKTEAKGEGGAIVDVKRKKSSFELKFDEFVKKGGALTFDDTDGIVAGNYRLWYLPEDKECPGLYFPKGTFAVNTAATSADGITQSITFSAVEKDNDTKQMMIGVIKEDKLKAGSGWTIEADFTPIETESDEVG